MNDIRVELDKNGRGLIQRIAPRYAQLLNWSNRTRFKIGATVYCGGKVYAAELHESNAHELDVMIWQRGNRVREDHLLHVRQAVKDAYSDAFGLRPVIKLGFGTVYRRKHDLVQSGVTL